MCYTGTCEWEGWEDGYGSRCHKPKGIPCPEPEDEGMDEDGAFEVMLDAAEGRLS